VNSQSDSVLICDVLREAFPQACMQAGKTNLDDIVRRGGKVDFVPVEGASRMHLALPLALLASGATVLSHALTIARIIRDSKKKAPSEIVFETKVSLPPEIASKLEPDVLERVLGLLAQRIQDKP
jgi:hypothetical protein